MADVKICDKCDKIIFPNEHCYVVGSACKLPLDHPTDYFKTDLCVDLCPDCYKEFENFIKSSK
jgi:hypothetical protein